MSKSISTLMPDVIKAVSAAISELNTKNIPYSIQSTLRTTPEQQALYAQGRQPTTDVNALRRLAGMVPIGDTDNKYTVTNCDGVTTKSAHQSGRAIDIVPVINGAPAWPEPGHGHWQPIADIMMKYGFEWGGSWAKFPDYPHYQMKEKIV